VVRKCCLSTTFQQQGKALGQVGMVMERSTSYYYRDNEKTIEVELRERATYFGSLNKYSVQ